MPKNDSKRKRLFIDNQVQSALARRVVLHWVVFVFVTFFVLGFLQTCVETPSFTLSDIFQTFVAKNAIALIVALALLPVFVYDVMKMSNRFAGPIFRLRSALKAMANGEEYRPLVFREKDFWSEIAQDFNKVFENQAIANASSPKESHDDSSDEPELQTTTTDL